MANHTSRGKLIERVGSDMSADGWRIVERSFSPQHAGRIESIFAVANGFLGVRGAPEEGTPAFDPGAILNGLYETWPIIYPEDAYGLARTGQTIVNAPDGSIMRLFVCGEPFDLQSAVLVRYERALDMRLGVVTREVEWETSGGRRILIRSRRLASLAHRHLAAFDYEVTPLDAGASIAICSRLVTHHPRATADDPRRGKGFAEKVLKPVAARASDSRAVLELATHGSGITLACGMEHQLEATSGASVTPDADGDHATIMVVADLEAGEPLRLSKYVAYHWAASARSGACSANADETLRRAAELGYDAIEREHRAEVERFWRRSDIELGGAPELQHAVRFNLFQLLQATACADRNGVPAKGVTGRGYDGHYFWDSEIYVTPFLIHTDPGRARGVLQFRCRMLEAARRRARELGHRGALYPWRTIDGHEASAWYAAGTAQYHINADIAYALHQYVVVTGDLAFLLDEAAQVMVETARLWMDLGFFSARRHGRFCINGVTGPDEYTTVVNNNAYTNLMAKENLEGAIRVVERLRSREPEAYARLVVSTGVSELETDRWRRAADSMYVPRHDQLGIVLQDDGFLDREPWDFDATPADAYPLLLHYHPLELYRHQVIKQPDVVLATYLLDHYFSDEETRRTFEYYDPLTTGDSTLSASIQSVMASATGHPQAALDYFVSACTADLADVHGNTADGIHVASCGGTWLALIAGFGGLRDYDGEPCFHPRLPSEWTRLRFRVEIRGQAIEVDMTRGHTTYRLVRGPGVLIRHFGEELRLTPGDLVRRPAAGARLRPVGRQGGGVRPDLTCCEHLAREGEHRQ